MVERALEMDVMPSLQMSSNKLKEPPVYSSSASIKRDREKITQHSTYFMDDDESYPNKVEKMLLITDPDLEDKKMEDLAKAVCKKKKQQSGLELKVEAK